MGQRRAFGGPAPRPVAPRQRAGGAALCPGLPSPRGPQGAPGPSIRRLTCALEDICRPPQAPHAEEATQTRAAQLQQLEPRRDDREPVKKRARPKRGSTALPAACELREQRVLLPSRKPAGMRRTSGKQRAQVREADAFNVASLALPMRRLALLSLVRRLRASRRVHSTQAGAGLASPQGNVLAGRHANPLDQLDPALPRRSARHPSATLAPAHQARMGPARLVQVYSLLQTAPQLRPRSRGR